jgi:hypothetical protein
MASANLTPQREAFARAIAKGGSQAGAYREAFPASKKWKDKSVHERASTLMRDIKVVSRVEELRSKVAAKVVLTVENLIAELEEARSAALMAGPSPQSSAAVAATMGKAKLLGLDKQIVELSGKDGGPIQTKADVTLSPSDAYERLMRAGR